MLAAVGWMHTAGGRRLLASLGVACPVETVNPQVVQSIRDNAVARSKGALPAPIRPALGLQLDRTTKAQVALKMASEKAHCDEITRGFRYLRCRGVPASLVGTAGPPVSEIWFSFRPDDTLVAINLYRRDMTPSEAKQSWQTAVWKLQTVLGPPAQTTGDTELSSLFRQPVAVARVQYAFSDYVATVTASHLPFGGLAVREQYMSAVAGQGS